MGSQSCTVSFYHRGVIGILAQCRCFSVFSKTAKFQDMVPFLTEYDDLQGWAFIFYFGSFIDSHIESFCPILWFSFPRNKRSFRTGICVNRLWISVLDNLTLFRSIIEFSLAILCPCMWLSCFDTCEVSGPRSNVNCLRVCPRGVNHIWFPSIADIHM